MSCFTEKGRPRKPSPVRELLNIVRKPRRKNSSVESSSGDAQPESLELKALTNVGADDPYEIDRDFWNRALQKLEVEKPDVYNRVQRLSALEGQPLDTARLISKYQTDMRKINAWTHSQWYGKRRRLILALRYLSAAKDTVGRSGRFDPTGTTTAVATVASVIDVSPIFACVSTPCLSGPDTLHSPRSSSVSWHQSSLAADVLQIALSKVELDDKVANDLGDVCSKIDRCADKEAQVLGRSQACPRDLISTAGDNLVAVYACVLEYSTAVQEYLQWGHTGKSHQSILPSHTHAPQGR
jgi:hypothetical protein